MEIISGGQEHADQSAPLVAGFRVELKALKGIPSTPSLSQGKAEYLEYLDAGYPIFLAKEGNTLTGYLVCRVEDTTVWVESLYVAPAHRRNGIASALYGRAEQYAQTLGGDTLYNYVHPNNDKIIAFLQKHGYSVLNLIELRRAYPGECPSSKVQVGPYLFDY